MTRLLFVEQNKADSLKAKSDKAIVDIVVDNPRILPEKSAKSLPALPSPPAAPESPVAVEGWNGPRIGGWAHREDEATATTASIMNAKMSKLSLETNHRGVGDDGDDHTEYTQESASTVEETATTPVVLERPTQLFPSNSARGANPPSATTTGTNNKKQPSNGGGVSRKLLPSLKKKSSKSGGTRRSTDHGSSSSSSGSED